jgi:dihydrodipicolinate synthase/N-acetylneuraminate lyase
MSKQSAKNKIITGVIPVQFCPYKADDTLDLNGLKKNTQFLVDYAVKDRKPFVIMTNGSTTECYANSIEEQQKVIETVVDTVAGRLPVIAGVSQAGTRQTVEMAKYAEAAGADFVMVLPPFYHHGNKEGIFQHFQEVASAIGIGLVIYNNPDVTSTLIPPDFLARLAGINNIVACKDNASSFSDLANKAFSEDLKKLSLIAGNGEVQYLAAACYGFVYRGFVSFIANFAPGLSYEIFAAVEQRDMYKASRALRKLFPIWQFVAKVEKNRESISVIPPGLKTSYAYMGVGKAAMDIAGLNGGHLRIPMEDLTVDEKKELKKILKEIG